MERSSGILLAISSLPSKYGIGSLGEEAKSFIDFLVKAKQSYWQILPVGPTSYGDSPYQCPSAYAGNPYFIDLDNLVKEGLLDASDLEGLSWGDDPERVDYGLQYTQKHPLLEKAAKRGIEKNDEGFVRFRAENHWLSDYCLYMALKKHFEMKPWTEWPEDIRTRKPHALDLFRDELAYDIEIIAYIQYLFFRQWDAVKRYAHEKHIKIIGDLPIYVALDSADVWAEKEFFQIDELGVPKKVAGVPPDYFNEDGQLWGNPLYDYDRMKQDGFGWWIRRIGGCTRLYDVIRIDHFRGIESYWAVPYGEKTAKKGEWVKGPGMDLIGALTGWFKDIEFIAEDLGYPTEEVQKLLEDSGFPGMKVIEFAFDGTEKNMDVPHRHIRHSVCYTGTHDNAPVLGWKESAPKEFTDRAKKYLGLNEEEGFAWGMIRAGMSSVSDLFIAQLQDYLELGNEARMNTPGVVGKNWQWRMKKGCLSDKLAEKISEATELYGRSVK